MFRCSIWFSAPSFWMGGGLDSRCVGRVYGADGAVHGMGDRGSTVVKVLCYKSEGRWFDPSWCPWNFSLT